MKRFRVWLFSVLLIVFSLVFLVSLGLFILFFGKFFSSGYYLIDLFFFKFNFPYFPEVFYSYFYYILGGLILEIVFIFLFFSGLSFSLKLKNIPQEVLSLKKYHASRTTTDLDNLYQILAEKKSLSIPLIAKSFKVSEDIVFGWGKILERGNLAMIDYPRWSDPRIVYIDQTKLKESEDEEA